MTEDKLLNTREVCELTKISRSRLVVMLGDNLFPRPIKIAANRNVYSRNEILKWINDLVANDSLRANINQSIQSKRRAAA